VPQDHRRIAEPMSVSQARALVDDLVAEGVLLVVPAVSLETAHRRLGSVTQDFFSRYGGMKTRNGGFEVAAAAVGDSDYAAGFLSIGHSEDWDVVQRPGEDEVFVIEGSEVDEADMDTRFPSIYHLLVDEAEAGSAGIR